MASHLQGKRLFKALRKRKQLYWPREDGRVEAPIKRTQNGRVPLTIIEWLRSSHFLVGTGGLRDNGTTHQPL
jgi:hypothetical protein